MKPSFYTLTVSDVRRETPDCVSVAFAIPPEQQKVFSFEAGQYLTLRAQIEGEDIRRSYSICTAPYEQQWRVAIKRVPQGRFSSFANDRLRAGDTLEVMPPMGTFTLDRTDAPDAHFVFFAAGSGITPILSLIKTILHEKPHAHCTLFFGNRTFEQVIFREELEAIKNKHLDRFSLHYILSQEDLGAALFSGRIDADKCGKFCQLLINPKTVNGFYICGPEQMIFSVKDSLVAQGTDPEKIHFELFTTPGQSRSMLTSRTEVTEVENPEAVSQVSITLDQKTFAISLPYSGKNILDAALGRGADLPFACKGGVCCTCRAKITEGEAVMDVNYALEADEVEAGFVLTCQAHPRTPTLSVDFDVR